MRSLQRLNIHVAQLHLVLNPYSEGNAAVLVSKPRGRHMKPHLLTSLPTCPYSFPIAGLALLLAVSLASISGNAGAHPGRTAPDGCHYCRTNCERWGVPKNQRHCHGRTSQSTSLQEPHSESEPTAYATVVPTLLDLPSEEDGSKNP